MEDKLQKTPEAVAEVEGKWENNVSETFDWSDYKRDARGVLRSATCRQRSASVHNGYKKAKSE